MKLAASQELHAYWNLLRGARSAPERAEIDPAAIRGVLADTFILEIDQPNAYPIRIAGTRTSSLFMRELKGSGFLDLWQPGDRRDMVAMLGCVADEAVALVAGVSSRPGGWPALDLELLLLPLRHHGATHKRVLGVLAPAAAPRWLGLVPAAPLNLLSLRVLDRREPAPPPRAERAPGEEPAPAFSRAPALSRRGHLYVVEGEAQTR